MAVIGELSAVEQLLGRCANRFLGLAKKSQDEANAARKEIGGSRIVAQASHKEIAPRDLPTACGPLLGVSSRRSTEAGHKAQSPAEPKRAYPPTIPDLTNETPNSSGSTTSSPNGMRAERPITLLQLVDGSMYGLTDYWVKDGELHYTTTYGGQNSLPLERIDFEKTVQLNADRGVPFVVRPQSVGR